MQEGTPPDGDGPVGSGWPPEEPAAGVLKGVLTTVQDKTTVTMSSAPGKVKSHRRMIDRSKAKSVMGFILSKGLKVHH